MMLSLCWNMLKMGEVGKLQWNVIFLWGNSSHTLKHWNRDFLAELLWAQLCGSAWLVIDLLCSINILCPWAKGRLGLDASPADKKALLLHPLPCSSPSPSSPNTAIKKGGERERERFYLKGTLFFCCCSASTTQHDLYCLRPEGNLLQTDFVCLFV